jgi:hypothetical protein
MAHAALFLASYHCGRRNAPLLDVMQFIRTKAGGSSLNAAFSSVYRCSRSSFDGMPLRFVLSVAFPS